MKQHTIQNCYSPFIYQTICYVIGNYISIKTNKSNETTNIFNSSVTTSTFLKYSCYIWSLWNSIKVKTQQVYSSYFINIIYGVYNAYHCRFISHKYCHVETKYFMTINICRTTWSSTNGNAQNAADFCADTYL